MEINQSNIKLFANTCAIFISKQQYRYVNYRLFCLRFFNLVCVVPKTVRLLCSSVIKLKPPHLSTLQHALYTCWQIETGRWLWQGRKFSEGQGQFCQQIQHLVSRDSSPSTHLTWVNLILPLLLFGCRAVNQKNCYQNSVLC